MKDGQFLDSWKQIAAYLGRSEKTCRRLERELGLPVHRLEESPKARVFAYQDEIDQWMEEILNGKLPADDENNFSVMQTAKNIGAISQKTIPKKIFTQDVHASDLRIFVTLIRKPKFAIPVLLIVVAIGLATVFFLNRNAKIGWARKEALPEIIRFVEEDNYPAAFKLALQAEKYIPEDPLLIEQWPKISNKVSILTTPTEADVYMREYNAVDGDWEYLGQTPIENLRIPIGFYRWKLEKKGYRNVERAASHRIGSLHNQLDEDGNIPPGMIRVPGGKYEMFLPRLDHLEPVQLEDFLFDKYEVTNRQFKEFVDVSGYQNQIYWKHKFVKDGQILSWEEAKAEFLDSTGRPGPATWNLGTFPEGLDDYPVTGISWYEAAAYAEFAGKSLPTVYHWVKVAGLNYASYIIPLSNFGGKDVAPVGRYRGLSPYGAYDMAGNTREWCLNNSKDERYSMGGAWNSPAYSFNYPYVRSPFNRSASNGFRCMKDISFEETSGKTAKPINLPSPRDFSKEKPASDEIFNIYKRLYAYDKTKLEPNVESINKDSSHWVKEKVTFNSAYGNERMAAYLFLPKNSNPPYQTVIYFPGVAAIDMRSSEKLLWLRGSGDRFDPHNMDFIMQSGRALLYPIYKSTYERGDDFYLPTISEASMREHLILWVKDFMRSVDYLETRSEINNDKLAYYGLSWGAWMGSVILALENRIKAGVLCLGGLEPGKPGRGIGQINYVPRVKVPILMLNARYDVYFTLEETVFPMFRLLGTPEEHKHLVIFDSGHYIPFRNKVIKETLDWFDRYLGQVK